MKPPERTGQTPLSGQFPGLRFPRIQRWYEFYQRGALPHSGRSCRPDGTGVTLRTCWDANQQVGFREMLEEYDWSHSPLRRLSTGAKHLHGDRP
ncbi:MAG TPA: hypothetical protein VEC99_00805, partial [Clostridia bacterium]|nr:hypothetical protein [Clostridia bacterium]